MTAAPPFVDARRFAFMRHGVEPEITIRATLVWGLRFVYL
jgi:hypothetical protein